MAQKIEGTVNISETYSNRRDKKNKHSSGQKPPARTGR